MASPIDIPSSDTSFLSKSPILSYGKLSVVKSEESTGVPLQTPWTLWLDKTVRGCSASEYESGLQKIYTFSTIQGFWAVYNNVPDVKDIQTRCSYHLMRDERRPVWEESYNKSGGAWRFRCSKQDTSKVWRELVLAAIGEQFSESLDPDDEVCGLTVSVKEKFDIVQLWNINAQLEQKATVIYKVFRLLPDVDFAEPLYKREFS
ncbi:UNVERIFIED_CONTAM: hypothetical protein PYX00_004969 [Menopon gallinae]|uniref:Eukaryotic translation initiation factor 4E n=1 Tax=Menopon gallinae TaxID=328185 RepID=A0AAW2I6S6_9NEOP